MKTDAQLKKDVETEFEWDPSINAAEVRVDGSTELLRGSVHSLAKRVAEQGAAWSAPGIKRVDNELRITLCSCPSEEKRDVRIQYDDRAFVR